jgi:uncharacterized protein YkwD
MRVWVLGLILMTGMAEAEPVRDVVKLTNAYRSQNGLGPLAVSPVLEAVAGAHGRDMTGKGFFAHRGSDGSNTGGRAKRQGYGYCLIAENIAKGPRTPDEVMQGWINSKGHRKNLLQSKAREIGVSRQAGNIWVMVIGTQMGGC